ncbi:NAD-P-binding protein [Cerioporus squamosus]|nr:NAD-P-binding protein [Cerioporus squamosus]
MSSDTSKVVVLVTGCSKGGIGFALSEEFASRGCIVYATARRVEAMDGFLHGNVKKLALDVTKDDNVKEVVNTVIHNEGQIDVLVNNAGISNTGPLVDIDMQEFIHTYDTNVFSVIRMAKAVIPHMASRRRGTIVNISSIDGEVPIPFGGLYSSSKAAVHSITDVLYMECTPLNIDVVLVAPGGVKSNIVANQGGRLHLPPGSLWSDYIDSMLKKMDSSQSSQPMPTDVFARKVAGAALQARPPRYLTLASMSGWNRLFQWLPRGWVLRWFWRQMGEGPKKAAHTRRRSQ